MAPTGLESYVEAFGAARGFPVGASFDFIGVVLDNAGKYVMKCMYSKRRSPAV